MNKKRSDNFESRADNIDILKALCAFLIVCIHVPFPGKVGAYFTTLTRVAVPVFFMITGYFYSDTVARHKEKHQIKKIGLDYRSKYDFLYLEYCTQCPQRGEHSSLYSVYFYW